MLVRVNKYIDSRESEREREGLKISEHILPLNFFDIEEGFDVDTDDGEDQTIHERRSANNEFSLRQLSKRSINFSLFLSSLSIVKTLGTVCRHKKFLT